MFEKLIEWRNQRKRRPRKAGPVVITWTGKAKNGKYDDPANWECADSSVQPHDTVPRQDDEVGFPVKMLGGLMEQLFVGSERGSERE